MRQFSANVLQLIDRDDVSGFTLVEILLPTPLRHTSAPRNITIPGIGTFVEDSGLKQIEPPRTSSTVDREAYKVTYADPEFTWRPLFEAGIVGTQLTVYAGFYNTLDVTLGGAAPGQPLTDVEDLVIAYQGVIDSHGYTVNGDEEVIALIEGSSPMADLGLKHTFLTSKNTTKELGLDDNTYDQVYEGAAQVDLLWGKS